MFRDLDKGLAALQTNTGAVRIGGTLATPAVEPVPLPEVGAAIKAALRK